MSAPKRPGTTHGDRGELMPGDDMTCPYCNTRALQKRKKAATCGDPECQKVRQREQARNNMRRLRAEQPDIDRDTTYTCNMCNTPFRGRKRSPAQFCSRTCRDLANIESGQLERASQARAALLAQRAEANPPATITECKLQQTRCKQCARPFLHDARRARAYCGTECRRQNEYARTDRPWRYKAPRIHQRDSYTCWLCGEETEHKWERANPLAPTLDHVVPRSRGGTDEDANLRTAHAICNAIRSDNEHIASMDIYENLSRTAYAHA